MTELKIKIPERWLNFINDYYEVTGKNRDKDMCGTIKAAIEGVMIPDLDVKQMIALVEKHQITDIREIAQWERDEAAGFPWAAISRSNKYQIEMMKVLTEVLKGPEMRAFVRDRYAVITE